MREKMWIDVYKRHHVCCIAALRNEARNRKKESMSENVDTICVQGGYPVSYTHLDVYKRQAQLSVTTSQLTHLIRIRRDFRLGHLLFDIVIFLKCGNCRGELLVCQCTPFLSAYKSALQRERFAELHSTYPSYKVPWKRCRSAVFRRHSTHLTNIPIACTSAYAHPLHNEKRQPTIGLAFFIA